MYKCTLANCGQHQTCSRIMQLSVFYFILLSFSLYIFLAFWLFIFLPFCHFAFYLFEIFGFLSFCHHYHNHRVHIYYHTNCCSNLTILPHIFTTYFTTHFTTNHYHNHGVNIYYHTNFFFQFDNFSILPQILPLIFTTYFTTTFTTNYYHKPYHNWEVYIYYHTNFCSNPTIFQFYHTFYQTFDHKFDQKFYHTHYHHRHPTTFFVPKRNTGKCFERPAKILRGLWRFGDNFGGGGVLTIGFSVSDYLYGNY